MATNDMVDDAARAVEEKIDTARDAMGDRVGKVKGKVSEVADSVKAKAAAVRDKIRETEWDDVMNNATGYVRDNPGKSIGIALGVGFALGVLLRRRSDD